MTKFCGLGLNLGNLSRLSKAKSRSITDKKVSRFDLMSTPLSSL